MFSHTHMIDLSESGGRRVGENKALTSKKGRFNPYTTEFGKCKICRTTVHQVIGVLKGDEIDIVNLSSPE